jgi:hypothetical protein
MLRCFGLLGLDIWLSPDGGTSQGKNFEAGDQMATEFANSAKRK